MKLSEFIKSSERTLADGVFHIDSEKKINLLHSAIGISTEVGEIMEAFQKKRLDIVNLSEECADIMWYLAIPVREFSIDLSMYSPSYRSLFDPTKLVVDTSSFLDLVKKAAFYGKELSKEDVEGYVVLIYRHILDMSQCYKFDLEVAMKNNQDKLKARFPDKFTSEKALSRNLETERKELEKNIKVNPS